MKSFQGHMTLEIDDEGKEKVFADFNSPQGTRIKRVEISTKKVKDPATDENPATDEKAAADKKVAGSTPGGQTGAGAK